MRYVVKGEYPNYDITGYRGDELVHVDHATDMRQVMLTFVHRLNPGDSIEWANPTPDGLETPALAWWTEHDGAMPQ